MAKLLLVEDDEQVRTMLGETLRDEGYDVVEAVNGREAVERYRDCPCDLVIMDIIMPEKDGVEAIHALRREFPDTKVIAISGGSPHIKGDYLLGTAQALGAIKTFAKPVDIAGLLETVEEVVGR